MLGIIMGSAFTNFVHQKITTEYGDVFVENKNGVYFLQRHGEKTPPHSINHKANIQALYQNNVDRIISVNSCGSMRKDMPPGTIVITSDYINLHGDTFYESEMRFTIPGMDKELRNQIIQLAQKHDFKVIDRGIYWQSRGPRFETKAEIQMFSTFADLVGMTMGTEATLAKEKEIKYANISVVDNFANGISELSLEDVEQSQKNSSKKLWELIKLIAEELR
ncbi:MAG: MTAP family purine nucleoside phosphorylase [Nanoarchaeota archaeon]